MSDKTEDAMHTLRYRRDKDLAEAIDDLAKQQGKTRSQILKGSPLMAWADWFASRLGAKRYAELVQEYHAKEQEGGE